MISHAGHARFVKAGIGAAAREKMVPELTN